MADFKAKLDAKKWSKFFKGILNKTADASGLLKTAYSTIGFSDMIKHFKTEKNSDGSRWAKLTAATIRSRNQKNPKILRDTGHLRNSFSPTNTKRKGREAITIFNNARYSKKHDEGDPSENLPKREFMYLTDKALDNMGKLILDRMVR